MAILSFDVMVNIAVGTVTKQYPDAKLYRADGITPGLPTHDPNKIDAMRVLFQNPDNTTVIIKSTRWGEFGEPELIK